MLRRPGNVFVYVRFIAGVTVALLGTSAAAQTGWAMVAQDVTRANLWSVAFGANTIVAVGEQGTIITRSQLEPAWRFEASGTAAWLVGVGFGAGRFVVVGDLGTILTSDDDGVTWTRRESGTTTRLNAVTHGGGQWLAVGERGLVLASTDGATWTMRQTLGTGFLRALAYGQGQFLIGGATGALYATANTSTFTPIPSGTASDIESIAISADRYWLVGSNGLWASASAATLGQWTFGPRITATTFRGVAVRTAGEAVAVAEMGAALYRNGEWASETPAPPFLATAVTRAGDEMIAVGFSGGIARADIMARAVVRFGSGIRDVPVEYGSDITLVSTIPEVTTPAPGGFRFQWYTGEGVIIPGATSHELRVSRVTPATSVYRLQYSDVAGTHAMNVSVPLYPAGQFEVRDPSFVPGLPRVPSVVVAQPDGKLLVAGSFAVTPSGGPTYGLARLNPDGSLDAGFRAGEGLASTVSIWAIELLADGRMYVRGNFSAFAGEARPGLARLLGNGALDPAFRPEPFADPITDMSVAPDGRLYVETQTTPLYPPRSTVARLALDGSIDRSFAPLVRHELVGVDARGRLLAVDLTGQPKLLVRYLVNGSRDPSYVATAVEVERAVTYRRDDLARVLITESGLYAAAAMTTRVTTSFAFTKFLPDGGRDPTYAPPPSGQTIDGFSFAYRRDGGLWQVRRERREEYAGGYVAASYSPNGARDTMRHATLPNRADYAILAVAPDDSLLAHENRLTSPVNLRFIRVRPLIGRSGRLTNLSVRAFIGGATEPLIAGFVTRGTDATTALVRAIGPALAGFGVRDAIGDPQLALMRDGSAVAANDDWPAGLAPRFATLGAFALPAGSRDAALESEIGVGNYTAVVTAAGNENGTGLVELYHTEDAFSATRRFINVSARGNAGGARPIIAGFSITGEVPKSVIIRASGPALAGLFNVAGAITDPQLTLYRGTTAVWDNDNWNRLRVSAIPEVPETFAAVGAFPFAPESRDAAMVITLAPGSYTAVASGVGSSSGVALVEVYEAP